MARRKHVNREILEDHLDYEDEEDICDSTYFETNVFNSIIRRDVSQLRNLLDKGAHLDITNKYGESPLHVAVNQDENEDSVSIVDLLLYFGCSLTIRDRFGQIPLHIAVKTSPVYVEKLLIAGSPVNVLDNAGRPPLMLACGVDNDTVLSAVHLLLDAGADVHATDRDLQTALHYTCSQLKETTLLKAELIYKLLYAGINVNATDIHGRTAAIDVVQSVPEQNYENLLAMRILARGGANYVENHIELLKNIYERGSVWLPPKFCLQALNIFISITPSSVYRTLLKCINMVRTSIVGLSYEDIRKFCLEGQKNLTEVKSLKSLARITVRGCLKGKVLYLVCKLELPKELEEYLTYPECLNVSELLQNK
ncbi:uncharacterized protein LOC127842732 isoform X1 [Dreissena polymorpha]|uniref:SOCS box domain-containing protein n=1 Tax=Dreissena polymorpha TaxID=45954 RepID=A0A9D4EEZ1_DREPO|nr:uncharacterized protein LOC127842732 isoform X1 [Dreissena polymorpha]KAH3779379.1 hypothetical protein DPMN_157181 [Dreissena polymorpha]